MVCMLSFSFPFVSTVRKGDIVHGVYVVRKGHVHGLKCSNVSEYGDFVEGYGSPMEKGGATAHAKGDKNEEKEEKDDTPSNVSIAGNDRTTFLSKRKTRGTSLSSISSLSSEEKRVDSKEPFSTVQQESSSSGSGSSVLPQGKRAQPTQLKSRSSFGGNVIEQVEGGTGGTGEAGGAAGENDDPHCKRRSSIGMGIGKRINSLVFVTEDGHTLLESDVLIENTSHQHQYHCIATTICDMLLIPKSTMYHIRASYPEFFRKFQKIGNVLYCCSIVQRERGGNILTLFIVVVFVAVSFLVVCLSFVVHLLFDSETPSTFTDQSQQRTVGSIGSWTLDLAHQR